MFANQLILKVEGENLNKFLNMLVFNKVLLDIREKGQNSLIIIVHLADFKKVVNIAKRTKSRIHILEKRGIYFLIREITTFKLISILFCILLLFLFSLFIFDVKIKSQDSNRLIDDKIVQTLKNYNIKPFTLKVKVDQEKLSKKLLTDLEELMWVKIKKEGGLLVVEYVKREKGDLKNKWGKIFAKSSGVIQKLILKSGNALVKEGDTVIAGQLLIDNKVVTKDGNEYYEDAIAEIIATTFYSVSREFSLPAYQKVYTSQKKVPFIVIGKHEFIPKIVVTNNENCDKIKIREYKLFIVPIRVGIYEIKRYELKKYIINLEEIKRELIKRCNDDFKKITLGKKIQSIVKVKTYFKIKKVKNEVKEIKCIRDYECLEDITLKK
ncbi:stage V sporulation protein AE [Caldicellulosiruptor changbaiensis]|uniref:Stage V sporulation protein AE n=1 Tax=Caldicellulosiruptor changbaiensis TaxID=1222016 RepID=A0A3T0D5W1_9FIRM|nr:sporulation protein YqfD [Caldicellulosiruptor changbaiensis]AZT90434.1 stage V sporulation protein AE [Caldicellulosiruptor changbaiensis]